MWLYTLCILFIIFHCIKTNYAHFDLHVTIIMTNYNRLWNWPPTEPGFFSVPSQMFWSLPLSPSACLVEDIWLIAQTLLEESWTGWWHHWIINETTLAGKMPLCHSPLALLTNYLPVDIISIVYALYKYRWLGLTCLKNKNTFFFPQFVKL